MHYFKRNIGDYHKKAGRLSMLEHGAYTLLIDACYDREIFPTIEQALDWCWAKDDAEIAAVKFVLSKFFTIEDGLYVQDRIREEIANYHNNSKTNKEIAIERERKRKESKARIEHEPCTDEHEAPPNHKPLTINQEPLTNITTAPAKAVATVKPKTEYNAKDLISVGVEESVARDFLINRSKLKVPLTETALKAIVREAEKAGLTLSQAIQVTTERGWRSFKAEYVMDKQSGQYITFYELATGRKPEF